MDKQRLLRSYVTLSVFVGLYFLLAALLYQMRFTQNYNVLVETTLFEVRLNSVLGDVIIFNAPMVGYLVVLVLNVAIVIVTWGTQIEKRSLLEASYLNLLVTVLLVAGQIVFITTLPERINGIARDVILFTEIPITADTFVRVVNVSYALSFFYVIYNLLVLVQTRDPKAPETEDDIEDEEAILAELLKD
jgi:hypothetical protein